MGLTDAPQDDRDSRPLEGIVFEDLVRETLEMILLLFGDANKIEDFYRCRHEEHGRKLLHDSGYDSVEKLAIAFRRIRMYAKVSKQASDLYQKARWSIHNRKSLECSLRRRRL